MLNKLFFLIFGIAFFLLFCLLMYSRKLAISGIALLVSSFLLIMYVQQSKIEECEKK